MNSVVVFNLENLEPNEPGTAAIIAMKQPTPFETLLHAVEEKRKEENNSEENNSGPMIFQRKEADSTLNARGANILRKTTTSTPGKPRVTRPKKNDNAVKNPEEAILLRLPDILKKNETPEIREIPKKKLRKTPDTKSDHRPGRPNPDEENSVAMRNPEIPATLKPVEKHPVVQQAYSYPTSRRHKEKPVKRDEDPSRRKFEGIQAKTSKRSNDIVEGQDSTSKAKKPKKSNSEFKGVKRKLSF